MSELEGLSIRRHSVAEVLREAGFDASRIQDNRHFTSQWAWDDGRTLVVTVWLDEVQDISGVHTWSRPDPTVIGAEARSSGQQAYAVQQYEAIRNHAGRPVRVTLQKHHADPTKGARTRTLDPVAWTASAEDGFAVLRRGDHPVLTERASRRPQRSLLGRPMPPQREPTLRPPRPEQPEFRRKVAAKTHNRCALSGAPAILCDAAHLPWCSWKTDNEAEHGILLRADLHRALDRGLIHVERDGTVLVANALADAFPEVRAFEGRRVPINAGK